MNDTFTVALTRFTEPRRSAVEYPSCMAPVRVICCGGKPGPGIVRIPEIAAPEAEEYRLTYGVMVRSKPRPVFAISDRQRVEYASRGGKKRWRDKL